MRASIWALTFSAPAPARTTGTGSASVARPPSSSKIATLFTGANVSATQPANSAFVDDNLEPWTDLAFLARAAPARSARRTSRGSPPRPNVAAEFSVLACRRRGISKKVICASV